MTGLLGNVFIAFGIALFLAGLIILLVSTGKERKTRPNRNISDAQAPVNTDNNTAENEIIDKTAMVASVDDHEGTEKIDVSDDDYTASTDQTNLEATVMNLVDNTSDATEYIETVEDLTLML